MLEINEQNNTAVLISSLDRIFNQGKLNGKLNTIDLYILNLTHDLLNNCCIELTNDQRRVLMDLYRKIYFNSEEICHVTNVQKYTIQPTITFVQAEAVDCNQYTQVNKIFYWQESDYNSDFEDIKLLIVNTNYLNTKPNDTYLSFDIGKNITYTNVGKISFAIIETLSTDVFKIYDVLNNDVTHAFDTYYEAINNCRLFVSKNTYSHGEINFKIKKI
jgi:hypothetical protein